MFTCSTCQLLQLMSKPIKPNGTCGGLWEVSMIQDAMQDTRPPWRRGKAHNQSYNCIQLQVWQIDLPAIIVVPTASQCVIQAMNIWMYRNDLKCGTKPVIYNSQGAVVLVLRSGRQVWGIGSPSQISWCFIFEIWSDFFNWLTPFGCIKTRFRRFWPTTFYKTFNCLTFKNEAFKALWESETRNTVLHPYKPSIFLFMRKHPNCITEILWQEQLHRTVSW